MTEVIFFSPSDESIFDKIKIKNIDADMFPLGLAYIASFLREKNHSVNLIDLKIYGDSWKEAINNILTKEAPKFVGIPCVTPAISQVEELCKVIKDINKDIKVVVGGPHATALPKEVISSKNIDIVVMGEGEHTFLELIENKALKDIKGICYKKDNKIKINPPRELIKDISSLPWPAYDLLPVNLYGCPFLGKALVIISGRGCPFKCIFCSSDIIHKGKVRLRNINDVVNELEYLVKKYNIKNFKFVDDTFTINPERTINLCKEIIKRNLKIKWGCDTRVNTVSEELLKIMKKAGCVLIKYGIESGDEKILKIIKKDITLEQIEKAVKLTNKMEISAHGFFIIGHPYDTHKTIRKTIDLSKKLPFDYAQFSVLTPFPETEALSMARANKGLKLLKDQEWDKFKRYGEPIIETLEVTKKELEEYHAKAYKEFYFRPSYILKRLIHAKPSEYKKLIIKALGLLNFIKLSRKENAIKTC